MAAIAPGSPPPPEILVMESSGGSIARHGSIPSNPAPAFLLGLRSQWAARDNIGWKHKNLKPLFRPHCCNLPSPKSSRVSSGASLRRQSRLGDHILSPTRNWTGAGHPLRCHNIIGRHWPDSATIAPNPARNAHHNGPRVPACQANSNVFIANAYPPPSEELPTSPSTSNPSQRPVMTPQYGRACGAGCGSKHQFKSRPHRNPDLPPGSCAPP